MKNITKFIIAIALIGISHHATADPVPDDMQAFYKGKGITRSTEPNSYKEKDLIGIGLINEDQAGIVYFDADGNTLSETYGESLYLTEASSLLVRFDINPQVYYTGSLRVKGKPGKRTLSGTLYTFQAGFGGFVTTKIKVKQVLSK